MTVNLTSRTHLGALLLVVAAVLPSLLGNVANITAIAEAVGALGVALGGLGLRDAVAAYVPAAVQVSEIPAPVVASSEIPPPVLASEIPAPTSAPSPPWYASKTKLGAILAGVLKVAAVAFPAVGAPLAAASLAAGAFSLYGLRDAVVPKG